MGEELNGIKNEGIVTRDELLAMGYEERKGQKGSCLYWNGDSLIARECNLCGVLKLHRKFGKDGKGGIRSNCLDCHATQVRKKRIENPEKLREMDKRRYNENPEKMKEYVNLWRRKNPEKARISNNRWTKNNPEKVSLYSSRRRALKSTLPAGLTLRHQIEIKERFANVCALTGEADTHMDHAIPLAVGHGGSIPENCYPLRADLNVSKGAQHIFEWFEANKERFGLEQRKFDELIEYLAQLNAMSTQEYRKYVDWCFDNPRSIDVIKTEKEESA
ncbi:hypothetical protein [Psychrobacillus sp. OK032]|uniref:hypothetical protein n=1 Tax=Psychrobacillus sp. OK032 TaxID=1884358 RepID=UPI0008D3765F|nr:hypothetical protein [Psychrobacillus sp. OK032]SER88775.1 hypothetical protein SAMN05518872_102506 [Psychrobacillus sp. OK032]